MILKIHLDEQSHKRIYTYQNTYEWELPRGWIALFSAILTGRYIRKEQTLPNETSPKNSGAQIISMRVRGILCYRTELPLWPLPKLCFCQISQLLRHFCFSMAFLLFHGISAFPFLLFPRNGNFSHILQAKFLLTHKSYQFCHIFPFIEFVVVLAWACKSTPCSPVPFQITSSCFLLDHLLLPSTPSLLWAGSQNPLNWFSAEKTRVFVHSLYFHFPFEIYVHIHMSNYISKLP